MAILLARGIQPQARRTNGVKSVRCIVEPSCRHWCASAPWHAPGMPALERAKGFEPSTPTLARLENAYSGGFLRTFTPGILPENVGFLAVFVTVGAHWRSCAQIA